MNDLDYLNQISVKPAQKPAPFFDKKTKLIFIIAGAVLLLLCILIPILNSTSTTEPTEISELSRVYYRSEALEKTVSNYGRVVKSSQLRSASSSLSSLLAEIKTTSSSFLTGTFGVELKSYPITEEDAKSISATDSNLEEARLNGILDRKYASEIYFQIRYLLNLEDSTAKKTSDAKLKTFLQSSTESLTHLEETFSSFSESK